MIFTIQQMLLLFAIYAVLGWVCEVIFVTLKKGIFENRGFLNGPLCPIYGFGGMGVILLFRPVEEQIVLLFLFSMVLCSALEFLAGFLLKKLFHNTWWDYSEEPFNIGGYICLRMSILWGFLCVSVVRVLHPFLFGIVQHSPDWLSWILIVFFYIYLAGDLTVTVRGINRVNRHLAKMAEAVHEFSDMTGYRISEFAHDVDETHDRYERRKDAVIAFMLDPALIQQRRLMRAFPRMQKEFVERFAAAAGEEFREAFEARLQEVVHKPKKL